jgi:BirA family transcriptional regulator, biotin operon repressor / biotin---[acetyl-CoA-carboxylase] ligase
LKSNSRAEPLPADFADALDRVRPRLGRLASRVIFLPVTESTNDVATTLAAAGNHEGAVVVAETQTAGRGRRGHAWLSPPGSGLYVSAILTPGRARSDRDRATMLMTLAAGVALAEAIETATALRVDLKWPNDLYVARRKLGGILAEGIYSGSEPRSGGVDTVILGYGINVGAVAFPPELASRATSLEIELGRAIDRARLFAETLAALARRYEDLLDGRFDAILDAWRTRAPSAHGSRVTWTTATTPESVVSGTTEGIDDRGALLVRVGEQIEHIVAGELTWL